MELWFLTSWSREAIPSVCLYSTIFETEEIEISRQITTRIMFPPSQNHRQRQRDQTNMIPGHIGIQGNEEVVNQVAKQAATSSNSNEYSMTSFVEHFVIDPKN